MVTFAVVSCLAVAAVLYCIVMVTKTCISTLHGVIDELRAEQTILGLQKQIVSNINTQITLQKVIIEEQLTLAMNGVKAMQLLHERGQDPCWARAFEEGRGNARYN